MNRFEARKKLLVAESEVYRELLKMEVQTLRLYGTHAKRRMTSVSSYLPFLMSGLPFVTKLFGRKKAQSQMASLKRMASLVMLGWKTYQRFSGSFNRNENPSRRSDGTKTAAEEYLSKRL